MTVIALVAAVAGADVISTYPHTPGTGSFGGAPGESPPTASYLAQTFQALAGPAQTARFTLRDSGGDDATHFRLLVTEVSGDAQGNSGLFTDFKPTTVLFNSGDLVLPNLAPNTDFIVPLGGLNLAENQFYALVYEPVLNGLTGEAGGPFGSIGVPGALFFHEDDGTLTREQHLGGTWFGLTQTDMAFEITFVPEPTTVLALLAFAALLLRRRCAHTLRSARV